MSWLSTLNDTYLRASKNGTAMPSNPRLLPISHTTQLADIEVTLDLQGNYLRARVLSNKEERETLIPCTEASASRTSNAAQLPHPLHDKLPFVAGDYVKYGGSKASVSYELYMENLAKWVRSPYSNLPELESIFNYLAKACLIQDLINDELLFTDSEGHLLEKWSDKSCKPAIFSVVKGVTSDAFVRFNLLQDDLMTEINPWEDQHFIQAYIDYYDFTHERTGLDYVTGEMLPLTSLHPKKIRYSGDSAKLLSANDKSGFTFRGRFKTAEESSQVAYSVSQRAHNALKWLIQKQGTRIGERVFLVWGTGGEAVPDATASTPEIVDSSPSYDHEARNTKNVYLSEEQLAAEFKKALHGYQAKLGSDSAIAIIVLDAATQGRMSVTFFRTYLAEEAKLYFNNLESWHTRLAWRNLGYNKKSRSYIPYLGAPSLSEIALAAFGVERDGSLDLGDKVAAQTVQRLFPCVINEALLLPGDIVRAASTNALYPQKYSDANWNRVRSIACSLIRADRNQRRKENWSMDVQTNTGDLAYDIGRWMAVLDEIETRALRREKNEKNDKSKEVRPTSVQRYFSRIADNPCATTEIIMKQLVPYRVKLGSKGNKLYQLEQEIASTIDPALFAQARRLDGRFLLGYDSQKHAIFESYRLNKEARKKENTQYSDSDKQDD